MASTKNNARADGKPTGKPTGKSIGKGTTRKGVAGGRAPVAPIKPGLPWGLIAIGVAIALFAGAVIGYAVYANGFPGLHKYSGLKSGHVPSHVSYPQSPPVGGNHNPIWQNCMGDVYTAQIANEHAVHSLEHGAVWITYRPGLAKSQVGKLTSLVRGDTYLMLSPYPGQRPPISLQAWGRQLAVGSATDKKIHRFIVAFKQQGPEKAACSGGTSKPGTDLKAAPG